MRATSLLPLVMIMAVPVLAQGPAMVAVAPVQRQELETRQPLVGTVEAVMRAALAAEQDGLVSERTFDEGDPIEKGATLVKLNADLLEAERDAAEAALRAADAGVTQANAELANAQRELIRIQRLFESRTVATEKEFHDAQTRVEVAEALMVARQANVAERKAQVQRLEIQIRKTHVLSPFAGVVSRRFVEVGQWVGRGDVVAELVQMDPLFVRVNVPESALVGIKRGSVIQLTFDATGEQAFTGKVEQILPEADRNSRTVPVRVLVDNKQMLIRPGFWARTTLAATGEAQLVVPRDAVVMRDTQAHVVAFREGKAVLVPVVRGASAGDRVAVSGEVQEGELVVIRGNEALRGGEQLIPLNLPPQNTHKE